MRILAVTADASLITALTSMMLDWEIVHVRDAEDAKPKSEGAAIALVDAGTTEKGIESAKVLWNNGVTLPCLIIGDAEPPAGTRVRVLVRPFSLQDLTSAVDEVAEALPIDPAGQGSAAAATVAERDLAEDEADLEAGVGVDVAERAEAADLLADIDQAEPAEEDQERPSRPSPYAELEDLPPVELPVEPEPEPVAESRPVAAPPVAPEVEPPAAERPRKAAETPPSAPAPRERPETPLRPAQPAAKGDAGKRRFLRRREQPAPGQRQEHAAEDPTLVRLRQAIVSARELEALVHELPVLAQPRAMAHAFLGEVVEMFSPQVAAVFAPSFDGSFGVIAAHGLSSVEAGMKVPPEQPLFLEIAQTLEAVLIAPVDLAQGLVAGIGGARTEALMAAPLGVGGVCHAVVVVGRQDFSEFDLDLLAEQAEEAAPGLALAQMIDRIRGL